jgi:hypothetical protein
MSINNKPTHHRLIYIPQLPAMVHKVLQDTGLTTTTASNSSNTAAATKNKNNSVVTVHSLQLDLFPLEADVISMEFPNALREMEVEHTPSVTIADCARSLLKLQDIVGRIPRIQAYGRTAELVLQKTLDLAVEEYLFMSNNNSSSTSINRNDDESSGDVAALVILDRKVDMVTPLATPLTYEGLLDDVLGIDCGFLHIPVHTINPPDDQDESTTQGTKKQSSSSSISISNPMVALAVNSTVDSIFAAIRNQHVEQFGSFLQNQARALKAVRNDFTETGRQKNLEELKKFVKNIPDLNKHFRLLGNHIHLAELVKKYTESMPFRERWQMERAMMEGELCLDQLDDLVASQQYADPYRFLRLLCLQSLCKNGIASSRYDSLRRDVVQTYGYEYLFVLQNLERAGLLRRKEAFLGMDKPSPFSKLKDSLMLIHAEVDASEPDDISYVSSGYAPLTVRLVQSAVAGWRNGRDDILRELGSSSGSFRGGSASTALVDVVTTYPPEDLEATRQIPVSTGSTYGSLAPPMPLAMNNDINNIDNSSSSKRSKKPVLMVLYVGGVTYMELAALRFLSKRASFPYTIICLTTKIINGNSVLESLS